MDKEELIKYFADEAKRTGDPKRAAGALRDTGASQRLIRALLYMYDSVKSPASEPANAGS